MRDKREIAKLIYDKLEKGDIRSISPLIAEELKETCIFDDYQQAIFLCFTKKGSGYQ
jgi:hypothetical protein